MKRTLIRVYSKTETQFLTNGLIVLHETKSCITTQDLNSTYEIELEHPIDIYGKWKYLTDENVLQVDGQLFRIYNVEQKDIVTIKVNARHIFYDLLDNLVNNIDIRGLSGAAAQDKVMINLAYPTSFTYTSDITAVNSIYLDDESGDIEGKNPVEAFTFLISVYGGELLRDNFDIKWKQSIGVSSGVLIGYRKNIKGISITDNFDSLITRIKPIGADGLYLPELYVDSPNISKYAHPKVKQIEFSDDNDYDSLRKDAAEYYTTSGCDKLQVNYKVDFVELSKSVEYQNYSVLETLNMGDTVVVRVLPLDVDINCKIIHMKKDNLTGRVTEVEFGNFKRDLSNSVNKASQVSDVFGQAIVNNKLTKSFLQKWVDISTNLILKGNDGHVVIDENGISIMDTTDKSTAQKVWRWNLGGLGYSSNGYGGTYGTAITQNGAIVADYITVGQLNGAIIKAGSVKTSALEVNAQTVINTTVPSLVADNSTNKSSIVNLQTTVNAIPGQIDSKVSASSTTTLSSANSYTDTAKQSAISTASTDATTKANNAQSGAINSAKTYTDGQVSPVSTVANNAQTAASNAQISANNAQTSANNAQTTANTANNTANNLRDNVIPPLATRMLTAEQKITPDAIVQTMSDSITYYKDTLLPVAVDLTVSRAGSVINPLNCYNFTGGTAVPNNTLVTMSSGTNEYTPVLDGLEVYGTQAVTFNKQVDRVQSAESAIIQQASDIALVVKSHAIDGTSLVSAINMSGSKISMSALNIDLSGYATFSSLSTLGQTTINGSNITTGQLNASLITTGYLSADRISGGTISGALLKTSNSSNYMMLHDQYIDFYNAGSHIGQLGYSNWYGQTVPLLVLGNPEGTASQSLALGYVNGKGMIGGYVDFSLAIVSNLNIGGSPAASEYWVGQQGYLTSGSLTGYATESWVGQQGYIAPEGNFLYLPNGFKFYFGTDGSFYIYDISWNKIFGCNNASIAGMVPDGSGSSYYKQLAAKA